MLLKFQTNKQILSRTDSNEAVELTQNYLEAEFTTDSDWNGLNLTALFQKGNIIKEVILTNNTCKIPVEVIKSGAFAVSLLGVLGTKVLTSSKVNVYVDKTIDSSEATNPSEVTKSLYAQLLEKIDNFEVSEEDLADAIEDYFTENPIDTGLTQAQIESLIASYVQANKSDLKGDKGDKGDSGNSYTITSSDYNAIAEIVKGMLTSAESVSL